ncbi:hypothetical protein ACODT4_44590 [Streptomyces sp. 2.9]|uniref:hypothetical protein n=1 Tax=Streptomyces tritrimontium TaxID=3406573 RepID=UPI003BB5DAA6
MTTDRFNRIAAAGTDHGFITISLADGLLINVKAEPAATVVDQVYLAPGLTAPDTEAWENEDTIGLFLSGETDGGTVYVDVPVGAVRDFILEHGGEHAEQDRDFPPVGYRIKPLDKAGHYPVHHGTRRIGRIVHRGTTWQAILLGATHWTGGFADSEQAARHLLELAELAAGRPPTAERDLRTELAGHGVTPHRDEDTFIGGQCNSWLVIGLSDGEFPDMGQQPYLLALLQDPDDADEVSVDRPVRATDEWITVIGTGDLSATEGAKISGRSFPGEDTAALAAYIAAWRRNPYTVRDAALTEIRAWQAAALNLSVPDHT